MVEFTTICMCCVFVFSSHSFWTSSSLDVVYIYIYIYVWSSVWINRVTLPILVVVSLTGNMNIISLSPFVPENLVPRDRFGSPVPVQYFIPVQYKYVPGVPFVFERGYLVQQ